MPVPTRSMLRDYEGRRGGSGRVFHRKISTSTFPQVLFRDKFFHRAGQVYGLPKFLFCFVTNRSSPAAHRFPNRNESRKVGNYGKISRTVQFLPAICAILGSSGLSTPLLNEL